MLHANASQNTLAYARIVIASIWLYVCIDRPLVDVADLSIELFLPRGLLALFPAISWVWLLDSVTLTAIRLLLIILLTLMVLGVRPWLLISTTALLLLILHQGIYRGFGGHVNHRELTLLYATILIVLFPSADGLSVSGPVRKPASQPVYAFGMFAICLIVTLSYAFIGVARLFTSGIIAFRSNVMQSWVVMHSHMESQFGFTFGHYSVDNKWLEIALVLAFPIATVLEILSPLALFSRRFRSFWIFGFIIPFHIGIMLMMNIVFVENCLLMLLFIEVSRRCRNKNNVETSSGAFNVKKESNAELVIQHDVAPSAL